MALKRGTILPTHQVAGPISIQTVRGSLEVVAGEKKVEVPRVVHTAKALRDCMILITVVMPNALPDLGGQPIDSAVR